MEAAAQKYQPQRCPGESSRAHIPQHVDQLQYTTLSIEIMFIALYLRRTCDRLLFVEARGFAQYVAPIKVSPELFTRTLFNKFMMKLSLVRIDEELWKARTNLVQHCRQQ